MRDFEHDEFAFIDVENHPIVTNPQPIVLRSDESHAVALRTHTDALERNRTFESIMCGSVFPQAM